jgi:dCMP deaminase
MREKHAIPSGERHEMCRGSHAELNAIAQAAKIGVSTENATILCTHEPCSFCSKAILNAGINEVVYLYPYPDKLARDMMAEGKIMVRQLDESVLESASKFLNKIT